MKCFLLIKYADGLISQVGQSLGTTDRWDMEGLCMSCVCVCAEKGGTFSYIMQIPSHIVIRAAEQVPFL